MTSEQLEASRAERLRQNGHGTLTLEDARTWIEETGLCLFLPKRQYATSVAPSFVEAVAGEQNATPDPKHIRVAEELLVRLETDGVAVRLNLLGLPGEQPDFVVASWVLPYVYALRGDRDWRRSPQLTGSRQVSPLATQAYKLLETGDATISALTRTLGREVTEVAVLRAITELWQQLRIIPVISTPGEAAKWQLLRTRYQKAIAEGASTSQVTAISVLASIYLQAVIAASMEDVEIFLAPLTARSKVREVLRGLVATRQVHTIPLGHAPHFYVAGTLPEFATVPTLYASSSMQASAYFMHREEHEEEQAEIEASKRSAPTASTQPHKAAEAHAPRTPAAHKPVASGKATAARPHFSRPTPHSRDRKPAQSSSSSHPARRPGSETRSTAAPAAKTAHSSSGARWGTNASANKNGQRNGNHASASTDSARPKVNSARPVTGKPVAHGSGTAKPANSAWNQRNGHKSAVKPTGKPSANSRSSSASRTTSAPRKDARAGARPSVHASSSRKPALAAGAKSGNSKQYGFTARPKPGTKKRG